MFLKSKEILVLYCFSCIVCCSAFSKKALSYVSIIEYDCETLNCHLALALNREFFTNAIIQTSFVGFYWLVADLHILHADKPDSNPNTTSICQTITSVALQALAQS